MAEIPKGIEAVLNLDKNCANIQVYITTPQLLELKERYFNKIEETQNSKNKVKAKLQTAGPPVKKETGPLEGKLVWRKEDGRFDYSKKIFLELGRHYAGTSPIITTPFPFSRSIESIIAYKVMIEEDSWIMIYNNKELMGKTQKGSITTTIYLDRRTKPRC